VVAETDEGAALVDIRCLESPSQLTFVPLGAIPESHILDSIRVIVAFDDA